MTTRLSININDDTVAFLRERAAAEGRTVTEIVRRMSAVYKFVTEQTAFGDKRLILEARDGSTQVVEIL